MTAARAVVDTNILVSAFIRPAGPPGRVVDAICDGSLVPVVSAEILQEYDEVLRRPKLRFDGAAVSALLDLMRDLGYQVELQEQALPQGLPDADDWPFIAAALAADCPVITGNARHFPKRLGVRVISAREWVASPSG